jgi:AraC family transcriptional regulator
MRDFRSGSGELGLELLTLWQSQSATVLSTTWDRTRHSAEREVVTTSAVIEFMRSGSYARSECGCDQLVDPNHVAFFNPSQSFHVRHPCGDKNAATSIRLWPHLLSAILDDIDPEAATNVDQPFREAIAPTTARCHLLQTRLIGLLSRSDFEDSIAAEEMVLDVVREAVLSNYLQAGQFPRRRNNDPGGIDRVEAVRRHLLNHWSERVTLTELAEVAGCSTWHLATVFRAHVGQPVYQYLKRLRLRHSLDRLREGGQTDLTSLALECGFSSHSHFTAAFRQEFGVTPSMMRL